MTNNICSELLEVHADPKSLERGLIRHIGVTREALRLLCASKVEIKAMIRINIKLRTISTCIVYEIMILT